MITTLPARRTIYETADYVIDDDPPIVFQIGVSHQGLALLLASFNAQSACLISASNPLGQKLTEDENLDRRMQLLSKIEHARLNYFVARHENAVQSWAQDCYLVFDLDAQVASRWAQEFDQFAWVDIPPNGCASVIWLD
jgi:hypothetical protein